MQNMINAYKEYFTRYFDFSGRTNRPGYWWVVLANILIGLILSCLGAFGVVISSIYSVITIIPGLAIIFRRLHDTGRSGWNLLWFLLPLVGWIIILVFLASESK